MGMTEDRHNNGMDLFAAISKIARDNNVTIVTATQIPRAHDADYFEILARRRRNAECRDIVVVDYIDLLKSDKSIDGITKLIQDKIDSRE